MTVGKLCTADALYVAGELCGSGQAVWQFASYECLGRGLTSDPVLALLSLSATVTFAVII